MGSLALSLCHLAAGRVDGVVSLKAARSVDIAAAQLLVRECGLAIELFEDPPFAAAPLDLGHALPRRCRGLAELVERLAAALRSRLAGTLAAMRPDRDAILKALENVIDPELRRPVTELDMVRDVLVEDDGSVSVTIALTVAGCPLRDSFQEQVSRLVGEVPGVTRVRLGFDVMTPGGEDRTRDAPARRSAADRTISLSPGRASSPSRPERAASESRRSPRTSRTRCSALGEQVGVLDGDIYGHSIPHMLGIHQKPIAVDEMIVPPVRGDLKLMSIGFFLEENAPIMWRGPMLHKALEQFLSDVHWGELDTLLVDMPPGTGDVAMSLGQLLPRAEALVVTTPQPAAQQVAVRAAQMAQKTGMRINRCGREHVVPRRAPDRSSSARAAGRRSRTRSACRSSRGSRSTR